jgi:hypothetical protein
MSLAGSLEDVSVADALQFIHLGGRTGTLTLTHGDRKGGIAFHQGRIVGAWGPQTKRLGELLIEDGVLEPAKLDEALRLQETEHPRRRLGQILLTLGMVAQEDLFRAVEQQIERTVYDLVTWTEGTFQFAIDDLQPMDDLSVAPHDLVGRLHLDTQMVLLDALRLFDEKNRDNAAALLDGSNGARSGSAAAPAQPPSVAPAATPRSERVQRTRLQVVSNDKQLADEVAESLRQEATVARLTLRDAGLPPPGEAPPIVLLDLRQGNVAIDAVAQLRRARPRAPVIAVVDASTSLAPIYEAGAIAAAPSATAAICACFRSVVQNRRDVSASGVRVERINAHLAKLRRIVGDVRSGLISTTISLSLMNIISESVERAVLFLVRRDGLAALGAFGNAPDGQPLAQLTRGATVTLQHKGALSDCVTDGLVRSLRFDEAALPASFAKLIGKPRSGQCAVFPVLGGTRVVAVIYADMGPSNRAIEELDILELAAAQAGLAFENELLRRQATTAP